MLLRYLKSLIYNSVAELRYKKPAIRLCGYSGQLHWTLAYGAKQTGSWLWRNYYFFQIDNGAKVGVPGDKKNGGNYTKVDWWNPWLMVWD